MVEHKPFKLEKRNRVLPKKTQGNKASVAYPLFIRHVMDSNWVYTLQAVAKGLNIFMPATVKSVKQ